MRPHSIHLILLSLFLWLNTPVFAQDQKVGLVLSGGGATGLSHVGVLIALEEYGIPIDYITGTSAGALIGSLYAAGYSPEEIRALILSEEFRLMASGQIKGGQHFTLREDDKDASTISFSFSKDSILSKSLPTNFIESNYLDFEMMRILGVTGASYGNDFDSLFVPFRCVASDIVNKESVVFQDGYLNQAVRASMTFPFFIRPIRVEGKLLFDGGLYNNFPADVMYHDFSPDYIIGSNVSYNAAPPTENDLISQITNMLVYYSDFTLPCEEGVIIRPNSRVTTFEFGAASEAIQQGYLSTLEYIDSILPNIKNRTTKEELNQRRKEFRERIIPLNVRKVTVSDPLKKEALYIERSFNKKKQSEAISEKKIEERYYRVLAAEQIGMVYPLLNLNEDSTYNMRLKVSREKTFKLEAGGHFSSRPVNTGYLGLSVNHLNKTAWLFHANSYFGKFYGSVKAEVTVDFPSVYPVSLKSYFVKNRWDYFKSFATFFEDVRPSFLIQNELYCGIQFSHPIQNTSKSLIDIRAFSLEDSYYQTENFTNKDTSDVTQFQGLNASWEIVQNSLNRKQFANSGHYLSLKARVVVGDERTNTGSTAAAQEDFRKRHNWINLSGEFRTFPVDNDYFHFGLHGIAVFNSQSLFNNYTATMLSLNEFSPLPDLKTYFFPELRSPQHVGAGFNLIFTPYKNVDWRVEAYYFQPFTQLVQNDDQTFGYSKPFKGESFLVSTSLIYHSYIGPVRGTINVFPLQKQPIVFQLSYGYVLFNERANR